MEIFAQLIKTTISTIGDIAPIIGVIFGFQILILKQPIPNIKKVTIGIIYVLAGLSIFLVGLEQALFPLGKIMATQLTDPEFIHAGITKVGETLQWQDYKWVYIFAFAIGFSTTVAEPALIAVAMKAHAVSG